MSERTDRTRELLADLESEVEALTASDAWERMLEQSARFHRYSFGNTLLIAMQRPEATRVAGFHAWRALGRFVRKGERGIAILAPMVGKVKETDDDGNETEGRRLYGFRTVFVFDVAQTDGAELADDCMPELLQGEAPAGAWDALAAEVTRRGFTVSREFPGNRSANGSTDYSIREVRVRPDVDDAQAVKTLAHELGHVMLHEPSPTAFTCRGVRETEAESVAFVVCRALGMSTARYSASYVAHWSGGDVKVIRTVAERVTKAARDILDAIAPAPAAEVAA